MPRTRVLTGVSAAVAAALTCAAVALGAAGDNDTTYGSKGISTLPTGNAGQSSGAASVIQDGKLVVAGQAKQSTGAGDRPEFALTRINTDGSRDSTFGTNGETLVAAGTGESEALAVALAPDGKIVAVGRANDGGNTKIAVARFLPGGQPDTTFGSGGLTLMARGNAGVAAGFGVIVAADGTVIVASTVVQSGANEISMDRVAANGTPDGSWHSLTAAGLGTDTSAAGITRLGDGNYAVVGQASTAAGGELLVARYDAATGQLTGGWGTEGNGVSLVAVGDGGAASGNAIAANGGRIVAAGSATDGSVGKTFVAALNASNGSVDGAFGASGVTLAEIGTGGSSKATGVAIGGDGKIITGGDATQDDQGTNRSQFAAARFLPSGALDTSFAPASAQPGTSLVSGGGLPAFGDSLSIQPDGKLLVAGRLGDGDGETLSVARYCSSGDQTCVGASPGNPGGGGGGGTPKLPDVPQPFECGKTVFFGLINAEGCLKEVNGTFEATGRVNVNGIIMQPEAGATIILDPKTLRLYVKGPGNAAGKLSARLGSITLFENLPFDITLPTASTDQYKLPDLAVSARGSLFGFPLTGKADLKFNKGGVELTVLVGLPKVFGGVTGQVTLRADLRNGFHADGIQITAKDAMLGPLEIKDLLISYTDSSKLWTGQATVFLQPFPYGAGGAVQIQNGSLKTVVATADNLNIAAGEVVFLQRISFGISVDPFTIIGGIGFTAGPQVAGVAAVRVDANFKLSFPGSPLARIEVSTNSFCQVQACATGSAQQGGDGLKVVGLPLGGFSFSADTDGQIAFAGNLGLDLTIASVQANLSGWLDGIKAFNLEGSGEVCVFVIACAGADGVVSTEGIAVCGYVHLLTVKVSVGVGIKWPLDVSVMGPDCDIGPYRASHASGARAARFGLDGTLLQAATPQTVSFPAGKDYALVRVNGDTAPPMVTLTGPDGSTIDTPATPAPGVKTDRFMVFKDYVKKQTIFVVTKPGTKPWTLTPDAGSAAITAVEQADPLPPVSVKAKVSGNGYQRKLTYDVRAIPGQSVRFAEVGGGVSHVLGVTTKAHGSLNFTPRDGAKGSRKITAEVIQGGLPRTQLVAAKYSAPARRLPSKIKTFTAKRTKAGLALSWSNATNADTYRVTVAVNDGRVLMFNVPSKTRALAVPDLLPSESAKASVKGVMKNLRTGPATAASVKAIPVKKKTVKKKGH